MVKKDGMILDHPSLMVKKDGIILEKQNYTSSPANFTFLPSTVANIISISFQKE